MRNQNLLRGSGIKRKILEVLENSALTAEALFLIFTAPYGSSYSQIKRHVSKTLDEMHYAPIKKQRLHELMYQLKQDGLIENRQSEKGAFFKLNTKGKKYLNVLRKKLLPKHYPKENDTAWKIVAFDIPEKYRNKRAWLRSVLKRLDFVMLQQSVWMGKAKLPREFIQDLENLHLDNYVEILAVHKGGTLRKTI